MISAKAVLMGVYASYQTDAYLGHFVALLQKSVNDVATLSPEQEKIVILAVEEVEAKRGSAREEKSVSALTVVTLATYINSCR